MIRKFIFALALLVLLHAGCAKDYGPVSGTPCSDQDRSDGKCVGLKKPANIQ